MCMKHRFQTVVLATINSEISTNKSFSAYDITSAIRKGIADGEIEFTDRVKEDVDGVTTFRVHHNEVRDIVRDLFDAVLKDVLDYKDSGKGYMLYSLKSGCIPMATVKASVQATTQVTKPATPQVTPPVPQQQGHTQWLVVGLRQYLDSGRSGVTLKQIQSRFKGHCFTCQDYAAILPSMGYKVNKTGPVSQWTVA